MAKVKPAEAAVRPPVMDGMPSTNRNSPSSPYTTEGTPAKLRMLSSMKLLKRFFGAYSSR